MSIQRLSIVLGLMASTALAQDKGFGKFKSNPWGAYSVSDKAQFEKCSRIGDAVAIANDGTIKSPEDTELDRKEIERLMNWSATFRANQKSDYAGFFHCDHSKIDASPKAAVDPKHKSKGKGLKILGVIHNFNYEKNPPDENSESGLFDGGHSKEWDTLWFYSVPSGDFSSRGMEGKTDQVNVDLVLQSMKTQHPDQMIYGKSELADANRKTLLDTFARKSNKGYTNGDKGVEWGRFVLQGPVSSGKSKKEEWEGEWPGNELVGSSSVCFENCSVYQPKRELTADEHLYVMVVAGDNARGYNDDPVTAFQVPAQLVNDQKPFFLTQYRTHKDSKGNLIRDLQFAVIAVYEK